MTEANGNSQQAAEKEAKDVRNRRPADPRIISVKRSNIPKISERKIRVSKETMRYLIRSLQLD